MPPASHGAAVSTADGVLFPDPTPPIPEGIDLRCCDVGVLLDEVRGARLVHADPPWLYDNAGTRGNAADEYDGLPISVIADHIDRCFDCAADNAYLLLWCTGPQLRDWIVAGDATRWRYVSGGGWLKTGGLGVGFHWRGDAEIPLLYVKGKAKPHGLVRNGHASRRITNGEHSEKPLGWLRDFARGFCPPGGLVFEPYAGLGSMARACVAEGRRYVGAEIDPTRHARALGLLAGRVGLRGDL